MRTARLRTDDSTAAGRASAMPARLAPPTDRQGLHQGSFNTDQLGEADGRTAYLERLDGIIETEFLAPFAAKLDSWRLGSLGVLRLRATARRSTRTPARIAKDRYDAIGIQYVIAGRAGGDASGRPVASDPGTAMVLDYRQPFSIVDAEPREVINIMVARSHLAGYGRDPAAWHGAILAGPTAALLCGFMTTLAVRLPDLPKGSGRPLADAFLALVAATLADEQEATPDPETRLIRRAENMVDDRIGSSELGPAWLSARLSVSRSELYAALERFGGVSRFITQRRLAAAHAALHDPRDHRLIREIAFAFGFASEAHFARTFRASYGMTASEARREVARPDRPRRQRKRSDPA